MHVHTTVSIDTEKEFRSSTDSSDGCQIVAGTITMDIDKKFQLSKSGPKMTPTKHGPREKQSDKEQRSPHQIIKNKNLPDQAAGRIIGFSNDF